MMIHKRGNRHIWMPMTLPRSVQQSRSAVAGISTMTPIACQIVLLCSHESRSTHAGINAPPMTLLCSRESRSMHAGISTPPVTLLRRPNGFKKPFICQIISLCSRESPATLAGTNTPPMTLICSRESRSMLVGINTSPMTLLRRLNGFRSLSRTGPCSWESTRGPVLMGANTWRSRICSARTPETFRVATGREAGRQAVLRAAICIVALNSMK